MPFTDEDLKRLKETIATTKLKITHHHERGWEVGSMDMEEFLSLVIPFSALISRLKAAEANMGGHSGFCENGGGGQCVCTKGHREKAWRAAAGKS